MVSSRHAQYYLIQFLCAESAKPADIHSQMKLEHSNDCVQHTAMCDCCKMFKEGRSNTQAWHASVIHPTLQTQTHAKVDQIVPCDYHVTLQHIRECLGISMEHVDHIITQVLGCWVVSVVWVPISLIDEQKATHVDICLEHLLQYEREGDEFLCCIV